MPEIKWTQEQRQAIETVDRDVLVSAAAGSGKTAVLAERCAYLVADAPSPFRCDVDSLLVVTFTDLSAAEMRRRIHKSLKARHDAAPGDDRLRTQVALVETAQISTLHSFCMWIVRRWFHRAGIDATAPILGEDEIRLLRQDVLDSTFERIYRATDKFADEFRALVEDYGLGSDAGIKAFVRRLSEFLDSIPDPEDWLARAEDASPQRVEGIIDETQNALRLELNRQRAYCEESVSSVSGDWPASRFYRELIEQYAAKVSDWHQRLDHRGAFEQVRSEIEAYELSSKGVPRTSKNAAPEEIDAKDQGKQAFDFVRGTLFAKRLKIRFGRFTTDEMAAGIAKTLPYVATLAELVRRFRRQYQLAKRDMGVMDFSDLERIAYNLLTESNGDEPVNPVVTELRQRFVHVLVDEFQDINPLQAKILSLVSRPIDAASNGNCFTVGDVKQSIYRFRLAEPNMFLDRARTLADDRTPGMCIDLQHNYRSTSAILEGVNLLFGALMSAECGVIEYDERAKLKPQSDSSQGEPIELHILERGINVSEDDDLAQVDASDPAQWTSIEREAVLVGRRIRELIDGSFAVTEDGIERPLRYGDICVLLRSPRHGAGRVAAMLARMGISCWTKQAEDSFGRLEISEMLALLAIIDNVRQDIPLATVLRSGILGERLDEDELLEVRCFKDGVDFHEAVRLYANRGGQAELQAKLSRIYSRVKSYRTQMRERPLADVLGSIYRSTGYLAYVGGLRDGTKRRANLIALHERARQFGQFRRQGLRRFLAYLDLLRERGESLAAPSLGGGEAEDCVSILSIHGAKGLEYPVVIAMEMGRMFNLGDSTGRMLFERQSGIGLRAVDREQLIEYPTALHQRCVSETHEASIAEELRVWYVATTRAKQKLILVGTEKLETVERLKVASGCVVGKQNPITILSARTPLTWFIRALSANSNAGADLFDVATYNEDDIAT
ncbi:MAG: UvrD-helicase domain-containing protein, partial [Planctomycetes bacterium]|nr:UvrD-helicase domain-containing protein [Planctomycetota bacterium]